MAFLLTCQWGGASSVGRAIPEHCSLYFKFFLSIFVAYVFADDMVYPNFEIYPGNIMAFDEMEVLTVGDSGVSSTFSSLVWPAIGASASTSNVASLTFPHFRSRAVSQLVWPYFAADAGIEVALKGSYPSVSPCTW